MTPGELTALYHDFGQRWNPTREELSVGPHERITVADRLHCRRMEVIEEMARLEPLEAAYVAGKMALDMRAYGGLGLYLRKALYPDHPNIGPIDIMAPFAPLRIAPKVEA